MEALFATHNDHKLQEVTKMLPGWLTVRNLNQMGLLEEIPEDGETLEENALIKARYAKAKTGAKVTFADDTGLEVEALDGAPGVHSARYAGDHCSAKDNVAKMLRVLKDVPTPRKARFRTVIALILDEEEHLFYGEVRGEIMTEPAGVDGFGYDPIFNPDGYEVTFAEMPLSVKNSISHRGRAFEKMRLFLENQKP